MKTAKTAAERMKLYRQNFSKEKRQLVKEKDKLRKQNSRAKMSKKARIGKDKG